MALYEIRPLQLRILDILRAVDKTCREHGLCYYIWAGTMIGAVRHKGFIPWDDDLDIAMPRPDYERLIAHQQEWLPEPFEMVCAENDDSYPLPFAKIQDSSTTLIERMHLKYLGGIYLDVFPVDGVPDGWLAQRWQFARYKHGHGPSSWIPLLCRRLYTLDGVQSAIRRILTKYPYDQCCLVADYDDGLRGTTPKEVLGTPQPYQFEDMTAMGVEQYHRYLMKKYGDYMTIPDGEHQRQHNFHVLDLEHPYQQYKED